MANTQSEYAQQIEETELSIEEAERLIEEGEKAKRLADIPEFRDIVLEGYFKTEAARLATIIGEPSFDENQRRMVMNDMQGPGAFLRYLQTKVRMGETAKASLEDARQTLEELREESEA